LVVFHQHGEPESRAFTEPTFDGDGAAHELAEAF
jgi:hypothetical protein